MQVLKHLKVLLLWQCFFLVSCNGLLSLLFLSVLLLSSNDTAFIVITLFITLLFHYHHYCCNIVLIVCSYITISFGGIITIVNIVIVIISYGKYCFQQLAKLMFVFVLKSQVTIPRRQSGLVMRAVPPP